MVLPTEWEYQRICKEDEAKRVRIEKLEAVIQEVILDSENDDVWGPDITVVQKLQDILDG
jgi:hypothetical protein